MRCVTLKSILLYTLFQFGIFPMLFSQHYVFIEAEGQQPFYLRKSGETYSSSVSGFMILAKLKVQDTNFIIGFPNKLYPEVAFAIPALQQDKGYALRQKEGKNWVLVDRNNSTIITGGAVDSRQLLSSTTATATGFADLLADATGDKTLLEKSTFIGSTADKTPSVGLNTKTSSAATKSQGNLKQPNKTQSSNIVRSYIQQEDSSILRIAYFEKGGKNNWDTIIVEIEKKRIPTSLNEPSAFTNTKTVSPDAATVKIEDRQVAIQPDLKEVQQMGCNHPIALPKDLRELQRKIAKAPAFEEQMELSVKAFQEKCFTTKQVKELGVLFWEEQNRLNFYTRLRKFVADPSLYGELEQSFLQEASKKAFRDMLKKQQL